jgi:hypothetical protein
VFVYHPFQISEIQAGGAVALLARLDAGLGQEQPLTKDGQRDLAGRRATRGAGPGPECSVLCYRDKQHRQRLRN